MKRTANRLLAASLAAVTAVSSAALPAFAREIPDPVTVNVSYIVQQDDKSSDYEYSDSYFHGDSYKFSPELARISLAMARSAGGSKEARKANDMEHQNQNFIKFARACGFDQYGSNRAMHTRPTRDTIGVNVASKKASDSKGSYTLVAVGIRGFGYQNEWADNGRVGLGGDHEGFSHAAKTALKYVTSYLEETDTTGRIKVWITGYSRGGAVSNLMGGYLDDGYRLGQDITLERSDLFVYPMEPPLCADKQNVGDPKYGNIHNIVNPADVVTYVPFSSWGFARYGTDYLVPEKSDPDYETYRRKMLAYMRSVPNDNYGLYLPDSFRGLTVETKDARIVKITRNDLDQRTFYRDLDTAVTHAFTTSRRDYVENLQPTVMDLLELFGREDEYKDEGASALDALRILSEDWQDILSALLDPDADAGTIILDDIVEGFQQTGYLTYDDDQLKEAVDLLVPRARRMAKEYPSTTATLLANLVSVLKAHSASSAESWLAVLPDGYWQDHIQNSTEL